VAQLRRNRALLAAGSVTLNADGTVPDSAVHGPLAAGSYSYVAVYSGDKNYAGATSPAEPLTINKGTSTTATVILAAAGGPPAGALGESVFDTATVTGTLAVNFVRQAVHFLAVSGRGQAGSRAAPTNRLRGGELRHWPPRRVRRRAVRPRYGESGRAPWRTSPIKTASGGKFWAGEARSTWGLPACPISGQL
jgi:hypothetical protein